jgi:hypothetical protein
VFGVLAAQMWRRREGLRGMADRAPELWDPVSLLGLLPLDAPDPSLIEGLLWAVWIGSALTLLRIAPRVAGLAAASAGTLLVMAANSFGRISHGQQLLVIMAVVLAVAAIPRLDSRDDWRFHWPVQLCRASFAVMLASAAIAKLRDSGLDWVFTSNLRNILVMENLVLRDPPLPEVALWIASEPWLWQGAAAGAVIGEAVLVLAVLVRHPAIRIPAITAGIGTIVGMTLFMDLVGFPFVALAAIFAQPGDLVRARRPGESLGSRLVLPAAGLAILAAVTLVDTQQLSTVLPLVAFAAVAAIGVRHAASGPHPTRADDAAGVRDRGGDAAGLEASGRPATRRADPAR